MFLGVFLGFLELYFGLAAGLNKILYFTKLHLYHSLSCLLYLTFNSYLTLVPYVPIHHISQGLLKKKVQKNNINLWDELTVIASYLQHIADVSSCVPQSQKVQRLLVLSKL